MTLRPDRSLPSRPNNRSKSIGKLMLSFLKGTIPNFWMENRAAIVLPNQFGRTFGTVWEDILGGREDNWEDILGGH